MGRTGCLLLWGWLVSFTWLHVAGADGERGEEGGETQQQPNGKDTGVVTANISLQRNQEIRR